MKVFVYREEHATVESIEVEPTTTVGAFLERLGQEGAAAEGALWLEDGDDPLDGAVTLENAAVANGTRVHVSRRTKIEVSARFGGDTKTRDFPPSALVQRVFTWAVGKSGFDLPATERAKHTLGVCGADTEADRYAHIGSLAKDGRVCFDLAPKARYQG